MGYPEKIEHLTYLDRVTSGPLPAIAKQTAFQAEELRGYLQIVAGGSLPMPAACTGPDGELAYYWDRGRHHLSLTVIPNQPVEFFYRDRETEQIWGEDYRIGDELPRQVVDALSLFVVGPI
jgi:hypothetical protein